MSYHLDQLLGAERQAACAKNGNHTGEREMSEKVHQAAPQSDAPAGGSKTIAAPLVKRSRTELERMPKPQSPAELEVLSAWYFGKPLHFSVLRVHEPWKEGHAAGAQYEVAESYNSYHGKGWLHGEGCIKGYDYSRDFWAFVVGHLTCGGIAGRSYGQSYVIGYRDARRLRVFEGYLRKRESGRLRAPFERLARLHGAGENTVTRDSRVQTAGRADGAAAVSFVARSE